MSSWHTPERKTEAALKLYIETVLADDITGWQIATRFSNAVLTEPRIEIVCETCEPYLPDGDRCTGDWTCQVKILIQSHYEPGTDATAHDDMAGKILDSIIQINGSTDAFITALNAVSVDSDFAGIVFKLGRRTNSVNEHSVRTEQELEILMMPQASS